MGAAALIVPRQAVSALCGIRGEGALARFAPFLPNSDTGRSCALVPRFDGAGEWPFFTEVTPAALAALLDRFAEEAPTDEEASAARTSASYVRTLGIGTLKAAARVAMVEGTKAAFRAAGAL
jgi:hypothetical protein